MEDPPEQVYTAQSKEKTEGSGDEENVDSARPNASLESTTSNMTRAAGGVSAEVQRCGGFTRRRAERETHTGSQGRAAETYGKYPTDSGLRCCHEQRSGTQ